MQPDSALLEKLVQRVGEFYITQRRMKKAQERIVRLIAQQEVDAAAAQAYLETVKEYFANFEREARTHLRAVDKRLENANQIHFNLSAERGVAVRRIEATQSVLAELESLGEAVPLR